MFLNSVSKSDISSPAVKRGGEAVFEICELCPLLSIEVSGEFEGAVAHSFEQVRQAFFDLLHPAVGQGGRQKSGYFHIRRLGVVINELEGVGANELAAIILSVELFKDVGQLPIFRF
jgi:hypothetical protein